MTKSKDVNRLTAVEVVKSNPETYWGTKSPTHEDIDRLILSQLEKEGCRNLCVDECMGWHIVSSDTCWFLPLKESAPELFQNAVGFPGGGGNGLRFEFFLKIIATELCVFKQGSLLIIKSSIDIDPAFQAEVMQAYKDKTFVAYKLD